MFDEDLLDLCAGADLHACLDRESREPLHECGESPERVLHPLVEVELAHHVIDRGCGVGRGAEEHRRVAEDLPDHGVFEPCRGEPIERGREQPEQSGEPLENIGDEQRPKPGERVVEEIPFEMCIRDSR